MQIPAHQLGGPKMAWDFRVMGYQKHGLMGLQLYFYKYLGRYAKKGFGICPPRAMGYELLRTYGLWVIRSMR